MKRLIYFATLLVSLLVFAGCALSPERAEMLRDMADTLHTAGSITEAQYQGMLDTIRQVSEGIDWNAIGAGVVSVAMSIFGINRIRGPVSEPRRELELHIAKLQREVDQLKKES